MPTYGSDGAAFTIARSGDTPQIVSKWYIMFGHVDYVIKAAPGVGIVSSAVLLSDCLDEIDWEWLGGDDGQVQSNYFGKGIKSDYSRGADHAAAGSHDTFHKYSIDWTNEQIVWQIDGVTVRAMPKSSAAEGQYPQTPMKVRVGAWSGGDPSNPPGTIDWAGGSTSYARGPFTMYLKSIAVTDYSTGTHYSYSGTSGSWDSINSSGGTINGNVGLDNTVSVSGSNAPAVTSAAANGAPIPFTTARHGVTASTSVTPSGWPWVGTATATLETAVTTGPSTLISGLPSGWTLSSSGKVSPPSAASVSSSPLIVPRPKPSILD